MVQFVASASSLPRLSVRGSNLSMSTSRVWSSISSLAKSGNEPRSFTTCFSLLRTAAPLSSAIKSAKSSSICCRSLRARMTRTRAGTCSVEPPPPSNSRPAAVMETMARACRRASSEDRPNTPTTTVKERLPVPGSLCASGCCAGGGSSTAAGCAPGDEQTGLHSEGRGPVTWTDARRAGTVGPVQVVALATWQAAEAPSAAASAAVGPRRRVGMGPGLHVGGRASGGFQ
mmetsp:Transcript_34339/g.98724  ORF Transcript_34339/g.98724 Transcript_34339/m.98724 type:complete len:230 (-) Transcript_34339:32-721(-)